jgi:type II secretory pathway component PulF
MNTKNLSISNAEKMGLLISLSTMLSSGITIIESIDSILEDAKGNFKIFLTILKADIQQGNRIYVSIAKFPNIFDKVTVNIIKAAEEAGTLDTTLKQVRINMQKDNEFMDKVKSAMMYPMFIFGVFIAVFFMILVVVIPKMATVFLQLKLDLPLPTKILIFLSQLLIKSTIPLLVGFLGITAIIVFLYKTKRRDFIQIIFSLPGISTLIQKVDLTRITRNLYMLLNSGITITYAVELIEEIVINKQVAIMIAYSRKIIASGKNFSEALKKYKAVVPSLIIKIIEAGEKSGTLDKSFLEVSQYLDYEVSQSLKAFTALLEPIMIVFIGVLVGGMMLSIIAPIYGLISQVGAK